MLVTDLFVVENSIKNGLLTANRFNPEFYVWKMFLVSSNVWKIRQTLNVVHFFEFFEFNFSCYLFHESDEFWVPFAFYTQDGFS